MGIVRVRMITEYTNWIHLCRRLPVVKRYGISGFWLGMHEESI